MPIDGRATGVEDHQVSVKAGRVNVVGRLDIADIVGREVKLRQVQRRVYRILNIDDISILDCETVDLERVGSLERILPTLLPERNLVFLLRHQLRLIDVNLWMRKEHVRHYAS